MKGISIFALFRSGFGISIPIVLVAYGISMISGKIVEIGDLLGFSANKWIGFSLVLGGFVVLILLIGIIAEETSLIDFLQERSAKKPSLLLLVNFIFGRRGKNNGAYEVLFFFSPEVRARGIVTAEIADKDGVWCVVHFSAPPTPFMGNLLEIKKEKIIPTKQGSGGYVAYILSYGASRQ